MTKNPGLCLLAVLGGQLLLIHVFQAELARILAFKPELLYVRILPGLVWPLGLAWLASAWLARRKPGSTALPIGYSLTQAMWLAAGVYLPVFQQGRAQGLNLEQAGMLAWSAGVGISLVVGIGQLVLAPVARLWLPNWSRTLVSSASLVLALLAASSYAPFLFEHPLLMLVGIVVLLAFGPIELPRPFRLSSAWLALLLGWLMLLTSGIYFELPDLSGSLLPNWRAEWVSAGFGFLWLRPEFIRYAVPIIAFCWARDLVLTKEAEDDGDVPAPATMAGLGVVNIGGALLGCGLPLGVLPGSLGLKAWRGGQAYLQGAGLLLLGLSLLGGFSLAFSWLPLTTLVVLWVGALLNSAATSFQRVSQSGVVLAAMLLPFWMDRERPVDALLTGLIWGGIASAARARNFTGAALVCLLGCALHSLGLLEGSPPSPDFDGVSVVYLVAGILFQVGDVIRPQVRLANRDLEASDEEILASLHGSLPVAILPSGELKTPTSPEL